jgi:hypothetical protein
MNRIKRSLVIAIFLIGTHLLPAQTRVVIMTDFPPLDTYPGGLGYGPAEKRSDTDDIQSMVRFLLYSDEFQVEGLVATSGTHANFANKQNIFDILYIYDRIDENLRRHDVRYPTADQLRSLTWQGLSGAWGKPAMEIIGNGKDTEASEKIVALLEQPNPDPVWFCVWGGSCDLVQALWKIHETRKPEESEKILKKVRAYLIGLQDGSGQWLLDNFPNLFVIYSKENYMGMFNTSIGSDASLSNLEWTNKNIRRGHGILGAIYPESGYYPETPGVWEGDSPSFLYLVSGVRGLNNIEKPDQPSWGGQFVRLDPNKNHWSDDPVGGKTVWKWRDEVQKNFAERANWMLDK